MNTSIEAVVNGFGITVTKLVSGLNSSASGVLHASMEYPLEEGYWNVGKNAEKSNMDD